MKVDVDVRVPVVDLHAQYLSLREDLDRAMAGVIAASSYVRGPEVEAFEAEFAALLGVASCVSCGNGTDALYIALKALGVGPGDEVITTAHSWIASSETIAQAGGRVVFVDTDADHLLDPRGIEAKITSRTKGVIVVHLYGRPADMDAIMAIARRHNLWVIEDCAQAHLARSGSRLVGTIGDIGCFSFYPSKNLGAMGDAGCLVTNRQDVARFAALFARHGGKGTHEIEGINSRLDGLQAAVLRVKMPHLQDWNQRRRAIAAHYDAQLRGVGDVRIPGPVAGGEHVFHLYVIETARRDALRTYLRSRGVETIVNYPIALPFLQAYQHLGHTPADFPHAFAAQSRIVSLPMYPELADESVDHVCACIRDFFRDAV